VLVKDKYLVIKRDRIPAVVEVEFDIKTYKSLSWVTRLVRILLVDIFEIYWCLTTSLKRYWLMSKILSTEMGFIE